MTLIPAFQIGVWNAWILQLLVFLTLFVPNLFLSSEGRKRNRRMAGFVPSNRTEKVLAWSTHLVIWPFVIIYSIFLAEAGYSMAICGASDFKPVSRA